MRRLSRPAAVRPRVPLLLLAALAGGLASGAALGGWTTTHRVEKGDTLWRLARDHGLTVDQIMAANGLTDDTIAIGALLRLPGSHGERPPTPTIDGGTDGGTGVGTGGDGTYGDGTNGGGTDSDGTDSDGTDSDGTDSGGATGDIEAGLVAAGGPPPDGSGPTAVGGAATAAAGPAGAGTAGAQTAGMPGAVGDLAPAASIPVATTQSMIRAEAVRQGVDPALALAVASVESGFDQSAVSRHGAVGVMQLMPVTAAWLAEIMHRPIDRGVIADNIAGGVGYLRFLLDAADPLTAVAGYYQGLDSVQAEGPYPDTRRYVAKVLSRRATYLA